MDDGCHESGIGKKQIVISPCSVAMSLRVAVKSIPMFILDSLVELRLAPLASELERELSPEIFPRQTTQAIYNKGNPTEDT